MTRVSKNRELLERIRGEDTLVQCVIPISTRKQLEEDKRRKKFPENLNPCVQCPSGARVVHSEKNEVIGLHCGDMGMKKDDHIHPCEAQSKCPRPERWVKPHHATKHHRQSHG